MTASAHLDYCYGDKVKIDSFCRLPRIFVTDEFYRTVPAEIKVLYGLMLDRVAMSMRNGLRDRYGRVGIFFTIREASRLLHVGKDKAIGLFKRMETLGLIRRRKQGAKRPDLILVRTFEEVPAEDAEEAPEEAATDFMEAESVPVEIQETPAQSEYVDKQPVQEEAPTPTRDAVSATPAQTDAPEAIDNFEAPEAVRRGLSDLLRECAASVRRLGDLLLGPAAPGGQTSRKQTSRLPLSGTLDSLKSDRNYTDIKHTEFPHYNQSIYPEGVSSYEEGGSEGTAATEKEKCLESKRGLLRDNVDYAGLLRDYPNRREEIAGYVEIMAQACCSDRPEIRINQQDWSQVCVRSVFEKLERKHIAYVLKCMAQIPPNIRNVRAYALSTLYNSYAILQRDPQSEKSRRKARKRYKNWHEA